ncbi:MAG: HDOD domain-containing protein [Myxococcota bacterium]|nr:HDOD domain-containing protein [Myxococcota bacterium]
MKYSTANVHYGKGICAIDDGALDKHVTSEDVAALLIDTFQSKDYSPPMLPVVALELMQITGDPNISLKQVTDLIERDPWLAARAIKIARSPAFGMAHINSIRDAVVRLGVEGIRQCILQAALQGRVFKLESHRPLMESLYTHSVLTAQIARTISQYTALYEDYAYMCGLLHDIGIVGGLLALAERQRALPSLDILARPLHDSHEIGGGIIGAAWNLPPDILHVISTHHLRVSEKYTHPLSAIICLAEYLANIKGASPVHPHLDYSGIRQLERAREVLRLDDARWGALVRDVDRFLEARDVEEGA